MESGLMDALATAKGLLEFLVSAGGLSIIVVFVTQFIKQRLKWEDAYAHLAAIGVAVVIGALAFFGLEYEVYKFAEPYWPLVVAVVSAATYGGSQLLYHKLPTSNNK